MEKHAHSLFQRFLAMLLCVAMLVPTALVPVSATEVTEPAATVSTETAQTEASVPEESEPEWILPECDCGSTEAELDKHGETCARKVFLEEFCEETAADIFAKWEKLPEECQKYILECLSKNEADAEKLAELNGYVNAAEEGSEDPTKETEDPTKETEDPTKETEDPTKETEDPTKETEDPTKETEDPTKETESNIEVETEDAAKNIAQLSTGGPLAVVWSGADFQYGSGSTIEDRAANNKVLLQEIITAQVNAGYTSIDEALFPGDLTPNSGKEASDIGSAKVLETLNENWGLTADAVMFATGNHDSGGFELNDATGGYDREYYSVYNINYNGFPCGSNQTTVKNTAAALETWLNAKAETGYSKPIFVMTHLPLHHNGRYDNHSARYIVDVLNEAGSKGLHIIFLFGHNHSDGYDRYVGGSCIYYAPGDTMLVSDVGGTVSDFTETTLHFTYMNAGYVGYAATGESGSTLSSCIFEIYEDRVEITRFNKDGTVNLKNAGAHSSSYDAKDSNGAYLWEADATVTTSSQTLNLSDLVLSVDSSNTTLSNTLEKGNSATVAIRVGETDQEYTVSWESFNPDIATVSSNGLTATIKAVKNGTTTVQVVVTPVTAARTAGVPATLQFDVTVAADDAVQINGGEPLILYKLVENLYDSFDPNAKYMILSSNQLGRAKSFAGADTTGNRNANLTSTPRTVKVFEFAPAGDGAFTVPYDGYDMWQFAEDTKFNSGYGLKVAGNAFYIAATTAITDLTTCGSVTGMRMGSSLYATDATVIFSIVDDAEHPVVSSIIADYANSTVTSYEFTGYQLGYDSAKGYFTLMQENDPVYFYKESDTSITNGWMWVEGEGSIVVNGTGNVGGTLYLMIDGTVHEIPITTDMVSGVYWNIPGTYTATVSYMGTEVTTAFPVTVTSLDGSEVDSITIIDSKDGPIYKHHNIKNDQIYSGHYYAAVYRDDGHSGAGVGQILTLDAAGNLIAADINMQELTVNDTTSLYIQPADNQLWYNATTINGTKAASYYFWQSKTDTSKFLSVADGVPVAVDQATAVSNGANWRISTDSFNLLTTSNPSVTIIPNGNGGWTTIGRYDNTKTHTYYLETTLDSIIAYLDKNSGTVEAGASGKLTPGGNITVSTYMKDGSYTTEQVVVTVDMLNVTIEDLLTPGTYTCTVTYAGKVFSDDYQLTVTGTEKDYAILSETQAAYLTDNSASVAAGSGGSIWTQDYVVLYTIQEDGSIVEERIPLTIGMLSATSAQLSKVGEYEGLTVTYGDLVISENYTLKVYSAIVNDYPEFSDEGAVKIDKWANTSVYDYFGTGTAQVNLSVAGIPSRNKANMVFILDASSSMRLCVHSAQADFADDWTDAERVSFKSFLLDDVSRELTDEEKALFQRLYDAQSSVDERYQTAFNTRLAAGESYGSEYVTHLKKWLDLTGYCSVSGEWAGMDSHECPTREKILEDALEKLLDDLAAEDSTGQVPDVDVAIAYFNSYTQISNNYVVKDSGTYFAANPSDGGKVILPFTNSTQINDEVKQRVLNGYQTASGTNYDDAMQQAYELLKAKQEQDYQDYLNSGDTELYEARQDFVIFMSDGEPFQFNYFRGSIGNWGKWFNGEMDEALTEGQTYADAGYVEESYLDVFEAYYHPDGKLWMAEAIKGDETQKYKIIDPSSEKDKHIDYVNGLGATMLTVGFNLGHDGGYHDVMKRIATSDAYYTACETAEDIENAFGAFATLVRSANNAAFQDKMGPEFDLQMKSSMTTGEGETVTLDPGPVIELKLYEIWKHADADNDLVTPDKVGTRKEGVDPTLLEKIWFNAEGTEAYSDQIYTTSTDGSKTYTNILVNNVICAKNFWYNTSLSESRTIVVNGVNVSLETETFYWNIGTITEDELVLSYFVYLTGSMQGERNEEGSYDTNEYATLTYSNYLGHSCEQSVPTPVLPWNQATVGYGFYLVNKDGQPIINQTSGKTGSFKQAVRITSPVYETFALNSDSENIVASIVAEEKLPDGYTLFDKNTAYEVQLSSDGTGYYKIIVSATNTAGEKVESTYVVGIESTAISGQGRVDTTAYQTANTVVWFAVCAEVSTVPDTVVIDYALPVEIDVLANDTMMGDSGELKFIGETSIFDNAYEVYQKVEGNADKVLWEYLQTQVTQEAEFDTTSLNGKFGVAEVNETSGKVRYTLNTSNGMQVKEEETFVYAVKYTGSVGTQGYYYSTVTVIPATTIYYEDNFVSYSSWEVKSDGTTGTITSTWEDTNPDAAGANQAQDRPGEYSFPDVDANNIYGYDGAYTNMAEYSLGTAKHVRVKSGEFAEAQFTFNGTGFDIISLTNNVTGTITVDVYRAEDFATQKYGAEAVESHMVDTYYGYKWALCNVTYEWDITTDNPKGIWVKTVQGEAAAGAAEKKATLKQNPADGDTAEGVEYAWIPAATSDALYQVPVMKVSGLSYDKYTVVITVWYESVLDHQKKGYYDFYLDAIRIYDPANDGMKADGTYNEVIKDAYVADGEGWPEYFELRNLIIKKAEYDSLGDASVSGIVFIDNTEDESQGYSISDYTNYGPNNELYLAPGQSIAFDLAVSDPTGRAEDACDIAGIHLAMKSVGGTASVEYYTAEKSGNTVKIANKKTMTVATATDLYYDITSLNNKTVVIKNNSGAILSITNVKVTYTGSHEDGIEAGYFNTTREGAEAAVASLMMMRPSVEPEETVPETTIPEETVPETTAPETTVPEETVPETTVPETTVPEETVPETTVPEEPEEPEAFEPKKFSVKLSDSSVKVGSRVTVTVTTGTDVECITVNGMKVTKYSGSRYSSTRTWQVRVEAEEVGQMDVTVVCYNSDSLASQPIVKTVTVTKQYTSITNVVKDLVTRFFDWLWGRR